MPSNEGRGYVLRRIMRRGIRYGPTTVGARVAPSAVVDAVIQKMGGYFNELNTQKSFVQRTVVDEEKRFLQTLDQGTSVLGHELDKLKDGGTLSGEIAFKLYDTYAFPPI